MSHAKQQLLNHARHAAGICASIEGEFAKVANVPDDRAAMLKCSSHVLACITNAIRELSRAERHLDSVIAPGTDEDLSAPRFDDPPEAA